MFPAVPLHQVTPALDGSQFFAVIISEFPRNPYVQQWSLSVQRELAKNTTLEVNYVGNKGTHLLNRTNIGQGLPPANPALCDPSTGGDPTNVDSPVPGSYAQAIHQRHLFAGFSRQPMERLLQL